MSLILKGTTYKIVLQEKPSEQVLHLLKNTLWGTSGPLYQHFNTGEMVKNLSEPLFFALHKKEKLVGTVAFSGRNFKLNNLEYAAYYSRYFSIERKFQGKIFAHLLLKNVKNYFEEINSKASVFYAYVEMANKRSGKLLDFTGLRIIRNFETLAFSRIFPSKDKRISRIEENETQLVKDLLKDQYKDYSFVNFKKIFLNNKYFVLKVDGEIVAGVHANPVKWKLIHLPGMSGKIIIRVLPFLPLIRRLINPSNFRFAAFEAVYSKPGFEKELFALLEGVCSELNLHSGMLWLDSGSELFARIKNGRWGLLNKLKEAVPAHVVAGFKNISEEEQETFYCQPAYISAYDIT